jgi:predicted RNase H-like HicB family nuclease
MIFPTRDRGIIVQAVIFNKPVVRKLNVTLDRDETGMIVAECPAIPGCVSQGKTEEEALANVRDAILICMEARASKGMPLTVATREIEVALQCPNCRWCLVQQS